MFKSKIRLVSFIRRYVLLCVLLAGFATTLAHGAVERLMGSHHMVALPWAGGNTALTELFDEEVLRWKEQGYDFVVLHMDAYSDYYPRTLRAYYDSCAKVGIKAIPSWAWYTDADARSWIPQIVRDTKDHPAQFKIDGLPVYGAFNLPPYTQQVLQDAGLWPVKIWAHCYYYVPGVGQVHWWNNPIAVRNTYSSQWWVDGLCNYSGNMSAEQITSLNTMLVDQSRALGKLSMAGVTPFYSSFVVREQNGFRGLETQWNGILQRPPNAVWWTTGNDWREESYVEDIPETPVWYIPWNQADMPPVLDHSGYRKFSEPFIAAFKSGATAASFPSDRLFLCYQLHPKFATPVAGSPENYFGGRAWRELLADRIFLGAHLTAPARLRINGVLSEVFPAGVAHFDIPLSVGGAPDVAIVRDGATVKSGTGPLPITDSVIPGAWNYLSVEIDENTSTSGAVSPQPAPSESISAPEESAATSTGSETSPGVLSGSDVGGPPVAGSTEFDSSAGSYAIRGGGSDIWNSSDQFQFARREISGDVAIVARVTGVDYTDYWAKAGLMIRASSDASSPHVSVYVSPGAGISMQWRDQAGGESDFTWPISSTAPSWLKLVRSGNTFTSYWSTDGATWQSVSSHTLALPSTSLGGLAVTAHNAGVATTGTFDNVSVSVP